MKKFFFTLSISLMLSHIVNAQENTINRDTVYFKNHGQRIQVVQTWYTHHYYLDTPCIQVIAFPTISGMWNVSLQEELNQEFMQWFCFESCEEEEFEIRETQMAHIRQHLLKVTAIRGDLMAYTETIANCMKSEDDCLFIKKMYVRDLYTGADIDPLCQFNMDSTSMRALEKCIKKALGGSSLPINILLQMVQFGFDEQNLILYYDNGFIRNLQPITVSIPLQEIASFFAPSGALIRLKHSQEQ